MHVSKLDPDLPGYQVWEVHEEVAGYEKYGYEMHDAKTGEILWGGPTSGDNGRGLAADIDPNHRGFEMWSADAPERKSPIRSLLFASVFIGMAIYKMKS